MITREQLSSDISVTVNPASNGNGSSVEILVPSDSPVLNNILGQISSTLPNIYYDHQKGIYWNKASENWININESSAKRNLKLEGFDGKVPKGAQTSQIDDLIHKIQNEQNIQFGGPLAGYKSGFYRMSGSKILVTSSPEIVIPKAKRWDTLQGILNRMFGDEQVLYFHGWMKIALESLMHETFRPGQALLIAGPANCGKSLVQNLITILLGGRSGKPYQYMTGGTPFNGDLFGAEHLMIEDEAASTDVWSRRKLGAHLKEITVNQDQRCHCKGRQPVVLRPFWRITFTFNDEPENLMVCPIMEDSIADKIILLRASLHPMPIDTSSLEGRQKLWDTLVGDLEGYAWWLAHSFEIPDGLASERFGITHYHHPEIIESLSSLTPESKLLDLIRSELFGKVEAWNVAQGEWEGTAAELESLLCYKESSVEHEARKLLSWQGACGTYLARLSKQWPDCFIQSRTKSSRIWVIKHTDLTRKCASNFKA